MRYTFYFFMHSYITRISSVYHPYVTCMYSYVICVLLLWHPYLTRMYWYIILVSIACNLLKCDSYVTHMWFYYEPFVIPIIKFDKRTIFLFFLLNIMPNSLETVLDVRRFFVRISVTKNEGAVKIIWCTKEFAKSQVRYDEGPLNTSFRC